uniref:Uncharacterized protein n=1 Tax=Cacopsylla melanoneura TaxID=428564 RepID=A0A8D8ZNY0_9HEMI
MYAMKQEGTKSLVKMQVVIFQWNSLHDVKLNYKTLTVLKQTHVQNIGNVIGVIPTVKDVRKIETVGFHQIPAVTILESKELLVNQIEENLTQSLLTETIVPSLQKQFLFNAIKHKKTLKRKTKPLKHRLLIVQ